MNYCAVLNWQSRKIIYLHSVKIFRQSHMYTSSCGTAAANMRAHTDKYNAKPHKKLSLFRLSFAAKPIRQQLQHSRNKRNVSMITL
jgi:hypothetical protein